MSPFLIPIVAIVGGCSVAICGIVVRYLSQRDARRPHELPPGLDDRLARMEQALDAIAVEVERVSEGQRFTTRLLAEGSPNGVQPAPHAFDQGAPAAREVTHAR